MTSNQRTHDLDFSGISWRIHKHRQRRYRGPGSPRVWLAPTLRDDRFTRHRQTFLHQNGIHFSECAEQTS